MRFTGRYRLGEEIPLLLRATLAGAPDQPAALPTWEIRSEAAGRPVIDSGRLPADEQGVVTGLFRRRFQLDTDYSVGQHTVVYRWTDTGNNPRCEVETFEIIPGGAPAGSIVSMFAVERPNRMYLLFETDSGRLGRLIDPR